MEPGKHIEDRKSDSALQKPFGSRAPAPLVGRTAELRCLSSALAMAAEGRGGTIFLTGQPGIGKTRLARDAMDLAKERGFRVLEGRSFPQEASLAYAPLVDAFRPLSRSPDSTSLHGLVSGFPGLGSLLAGSRLRASSLPLEGPGNSSLEKTRLYEAVLRFVDQLSQEKPLLLFIDDAQWADPATIEILHYLSRGLSEQRALLLVTCLDSALNTSRGLRSMLRSLQRNGLAQEIPVPRLETGSVGKLVAGILGEQAPAILLSLLEARAEGVPLFIEALIAALVDSGNLRRSQDGWTFDVEGTNVLPQSVRHLILERLDRLAPAQRRILDLIAVMGDTASHAVLQAAGDMGEQALLDALQRLRARGLVGESTAGSEVTYGITHPLIQEVAYAELPEMVRRRAHAAAIKALESSSIGRAEDVSRLARHYRGAGPEADRDRAVTVLIAAGEKALAVYANDEAAEYFDTALAFVRDGGGWREEGEGNPATLPRLLEHLGEARERIGKRRAAVEVWNEALAERERAGDVLAASRLHRRLAMMEWDCGHFDVANSHIRDGLTVLQTRAGCEPCQELVDLQSLRFHHLHRLGDKAGMANVSKELLSLAEKLASPQVEADANLVASVVGLEHGEVDIARERALHALQVSDKAGDLWNNCRAHAVLSVIGRRQGDHRFIRYHTECGLAVTRRLGAPTFDVILGIRLAWANYLSGDWNESRRRGIDTIVLARRVGYPRDLAYALAERAMVAALVGESVEAEARISEVKTVFGNPSGEEAVDRYVFPLVNIVEAVLALEQGQVERALDIASGFIDPPETALPGTIVREVAGLTLEYMPIGLMLLAEAQVAAGHAGAALQTAGKIGGLGSSDTPYLTALSCRAEGLARTALNQNEAALACLTRASETFTSLDLPFETAKCLLEKAIAAAELQPEIATNAAQKSLEAFQRLGARIHSGRARQVLRDMGIRSPSHRIPRQNAGPLSGREFEIACLAARGLTTAEMADRLSLSPLTVGTHLHHIYSRLGIGSRSALTKYVIEAGLISPSNQNT
ncbi:MAG: AAA family ATPase [Dehalococcoidia bacterium]|nr:AAA family ATPase [Dehalococcoidia bacterium]